MNSCFGFSFANLRSRLRNQGNGRSVPAGRAPVNVEASRESACRSSTLQMVHEGLSARLRRQRGLHRHRGGESGDALGCGEASRRVSKHGSRAVFPTGHVPVWQWGQRLGGVPSASWPWKQCGEVQSRAVSAAVRSPGSQDGARWRADPPRQAGSASAPGDRTPSWREALRPCPASRPDPPPARCRPPASGESRWRTRHGPVRNRRSALGRSRYADACAYHAPPRMRA